MGTTHRLSPRDVAVLARAWRGGVGAGQLLLTTAAAAAESAAGAGTVALPTRHGRVEIRARLDGTPGLAGSQVSVDPSRTVPRSVTGDDEEGSHAGGLRIGGNVSRVGCIRATGDMVVEQMVDQAELHAGRSLIVEGRATASELHAGSATGALQRIHRTAHDVADRLALVVDEYAQVAAAATEAAAAPRPADLVRALTERRHPELAGMVDEVSGVLSDARRGWPELLAELGDVIRDVARLLDPGRAP